MLADFGIALAVKEAGGNRLTETGLSLGTPQYMSPEQATGDRTLDARSDVYSLAAVLYEMLAGEPPVTGPSAQAMIAKLMMERPTHLRVVRESVPLNIDAAVAKALDKTPADRFPSAGEFAKALEIKHETGAVASAAPAAGGGRALARAHDRRGHRRRRGRRAHRRLRHGQVRPSRRQLRPARPHAAHVLGEFHRLRDLLRRQAARLRDTELYARHVHVLRGCAGRRRHEHAPDPGWRHIAVLPRVEPRPPRAHLRRLLQRALRLLPALRARRAAGVPHTRHRHLLGGRRFTADHAAVRERRLCPLHSRRIRSAASCTTASTSRGSARGSRGSACRPTAIGSWRSSSSAATGSGR